MSDKDKGADPFGLGDDDFEFSSMPRPAEEADGALAQFGFEDEEFMPPPDAAVPSAHDAGFEGFEDPNAFEGFEEEAPRAAASVAASVAPSAPATPFDDVAEPEGDIFGSAGQDDDDVLEDEPEVVNDKPKGNRVVQYAIYGVGALFVGGILYAGSIVLPPVLGIGGTTEQVAEMPSSPMPDFSVPSATVTPPPGLPSLPEPDAGPAQSMPVPQLPSGTASMPEPVLPGILPAGDDPFDTADIAIPPVSSDTQVSGLARPEDGPAPLLDLPGASGPVASDTSLAGEVESLRRQNSELVELVAAFETRLARIEGRAGSLEAPTPSATPPAKPVIVDNWTLQGAQGDVAWVRGPDGFQEVKVGSEVDGVGVVENITRYEDAWIVVTSAGVITQ